MSGALIATCGTLAPALAGGATSPVTGPMSWTDLYGTDTAATQSILVTGASGPITFSASHTGGGMLGYALNGNPTLYVGAFVAHPDDQLSWFVTLPPVDTASAAGMVTVNNVSAGTTVDTFNYVLNSSRAPTP